MTMISKRIKEIRTSQKLSREKFGEKIGVSRGVIENIEYQRAEIKDLYIHLICKEFHVNEHWLRTGSGEPYVSKTEEEELADLLFTLTTTNNQILKEAILDMTKLSTEDILVLKNVIDALLNKQKAKQP
ncbi:helix-turn-helix transcriptional regulator [Bacillus sp. 196mf]|uniref:helix-turn-helix domain-containing protein n=1 Tax=Bacillus sp. 196mf TaxID=1761754 RepID=UPI000D7C7587|nr:helix-turn-helix transcriptional regulator [Bacillus sp. 196mf]PYE89394.1 helix-turn-helix protein [Bacillus sp. 196mf]